MILSSSPARPIHWSRLLGFAFFVCLFLFYIDEGRYTLNGLQQPGNIAAMSLYLIGLLLGLFVTNAMFARRAPGPRRTALVLLLGMVIGIGLTVLFIIAVRGGSLPD